MCWKTIFQVRLQFLSSSSSQEMSVDDERYVQAEVSHRTHYDEYGRAVVPSYNTHGGLNGEDFSVVLYATPELAETVVFVVVDGEILTVCGLRSDERIPTQHCHWGPCEDKEDDLQDFLPSH